MSGGQKLLMSEPPKGWHLDLGQGLDRAVDGQCIGISNDLPAEQVLSLAAQYNLHHICQRSGQHFDQEVNSAHCLVETPESYLTFPVSTILSPQNLNATQERSYIIADESFNCSSQKQTVLKQVVKALVQKGFSQILIDDVNSVVDELFTNAIFNAPFVNQTTQKNPGVSRFSMEITLARDKHVRLFVAHDKDRLLIGCHDPFGSLDLQTHIKKIKTTYENGPAGTMNYGTGGAGIGSYIIFNAGTSLYFGVWPGHATILTCIVPLGMSNRQRQQLPKHFHWIQP